MRYGDDSNDCGAMKLQFDTGRGTNMRLSQINVIPVQLNAIFLTHMHGDHTEGLADIMMLRWYFKGPKIDIVCSADAVWPPGVTNSCRNFVMQLRMHSCSPARSPNAAPRIERFLRAGQPT